MIRIECMDIQIFCDIFLKIFRKWYCNIIFVILKLYQILHFISATQFLEIDFIDFDSKINMMPYLLLITIFLKIIATLMLLFPFMLYYIKINVVFRNEYNHKWVISHHVLITWILQFRYYVLRRVRHDYSKSVNFQMKQNRCSMNKTASNL